MPEPFKPLNQLAKEAGFWLKRGLRVLNVPVLLVATLGILFFLPEILGCKERDVRVLGWAYQFIGFLMLVYHFNLEAHDNGFDSIQTWWKDRPRLRKPAAVTVHLAGVLGGATVIGSARLSVKAGPNSSLEQRLMIVEDSLNSLERHISTSDRQNYEQIVQLRDEKNKSVEELSAQIKSIRLNMKDLSGKSARLNLSGIAFFISGIALASLSPEISSLFGNEFSCSTPLF